MDTSTLVLVGLVAVVVIPWLLWKWIDHRKNRYGQVLHKDIAALGDDIVPISLHPEVKLETCIGSGACTRACPEHEVLMLVDGHAKLVNPLSCVGHGECLRACPVGAISLVFGTATRGVELPRVNTNFETSQQGIYIVGELGGMGLIRNAIEQGRQAAMAIIKSGRRSVVADYDAIVVGAGPAGISASLALISHGLRIQIVEQGLYGGTIRHYPRAKIVMSGNLDFPGYGKVRRQTMSKEDLVELWDDIRARMQFPVREGEKIERIAKTDAGWAVSSAGWNSTAPNVILALGRRGAPRELGIPGEELNKVHYRVIEPEPFADKHVLIIGGGNAAADCAIALADAGASKSISISYRKQEFLRMRLSVRQRLMQLIEGGQVNAYLGSEPLSIAETTVTLKGDKGEFALVNDAVIVQIGGTLPNDLLRSVGIELVEKFAEA